MNLKNDFYRNDKDEIQYADLCVDCIKKCKQSYRVMITWCPTLKKKNNKKKGGK